VNGDGQYDVVIVGAGINGALIAKHLTHAGLRVLVLEAGPDSATAFDGYARHLEHFYQATPKGPESAWPPALGAPQPDTADLHAGGGYFVQNGPQKYGSTYTRLAGGSTLHWLGVCLRMLPEDFELHTRYGVGRDWPLGYAELEPYYRKAEYEIGVAADVADQTHHGIEFPADYDYPMRRIPPSYLDQTLGAAVDGMQVALGGEQFTLKVRNYPAGRNSVPRGDYEPIGALDERGEGQALARDLGQRCAGNTACTPICPIQAKYNAGKTLAQADRGRLEVLTQAVASKIHLDPVSGVVEGIEYQRYEDPGSPRHTVHVAKARTYVLASHAVENAKLMLAAGAGGASGQLGRNLMDHPALYVWGLMPVPVGAYRGPLSTAGIEDLRGGRFRAQHAAFRFDIGNDGWRATTGAPDTAVAAAVTQENLFGSKLRERLATTLPRHIRFSLAVEQLPSPDNRISIDPSYLDPLGNPRPVINYHIDDYTLAGMAAAAETSRQVFQRAGITDCTNPDEGTWFPSVAYGDSVFHYHGMGHFAGTHGMGDRPETSVVNADQRSWEHTNLYVVGSGSFPTIATSNPTLTMAALTLRTVQRMIAELAR
jgi:choline dehydrogenase-like flavoprotein